uniref:Uncharacterized protein n=1 Tax=Panagrolaimus davidi TaxID=227884 RepID=A0A914QFG0_9BILA
MNSFAEAFPLKATTDYEQIHSYDSLNFDDKQISINGFPYRFSVANKIDGKTFFRCMDCRNLKNKNKDKSSSVIVGTLVLHTKEKVLKGDVNAPGGYQHLCNDPIICPLSLTAINGYDIVESLKSRSIIDPSFYQFDKLLLKIANQPSAFKKIGCTEGARYYACVYCSLLKTYRHEMDNFLIFNIHQKSLYSNVGGLTMLKHVCKAKVQCAHPFFENVDNDDISEYGDDFDTVSVCDSASNVGLKRPHQDHDFRSSPGNDVDDTDSVTVVNELPRRPSPTPSDIQPPKQRRTFSSYFNFSFIPSSRSTEGPTVSVPTWQHQQPSQSSSRGNRSDESNDQQEMNSEGKVLMGSTILRRVYVQQSSGEKFVFPHADILLPIEEFPDIDQSADRRNALRNCPKPKVVIFADSLLTLLDPTSLNSNVLLIRIEKMAYIGSALNEFLKYADKEILTPECLFVIVAGYDMVRCFRNLPLLSTASQLHKDIIEFAKKISPSRIVHVTTPEIGLLQSALQLLNLGMLQALTLENNGNIHVYNFAEEVKKSSFANTSVLTRTLFLLKGIEDTFGCSLLSLPNQ